MGRPSRSEWRYTTRPTRKPGQRHPQPASLPATPAQMHRRTLGPLVGVDNGHMEHNRNNVKLYFKIIFSLGFAGGVAEGGGGA